MKIQYYLMKNSFSSPDESRYVAKVKKPGILYQEDLIKKMLYKNTTLTRQDILCVLDLMKETVQDQISAGYSIHTDLFRAGVSIRGGFNSPVEKFDRKKHRVCVNMKASLDFQKDMASNASVEKVRKKTVRPAVSGIVRFGDEASAGRYYPGDLIEFRGWALKRKECKSRVFLFPALEGADWGQDKVSLKVHRVYDRSLLCSLPDNLASGLYRIYVDSGTDSSLPLAEYDEPLDVAENTVDFQA